MTRDEFNIYCSSLKATTNVIQWRNASVWKVGGKIFTICAPWGEGNQQKISFKCSDMSYEILREQPDIIPAPYLARAKWVQLVTSDAMDDGDIKLYIQKAHDIIVSKLTKVARNQLGF